MIGNILRELHMAFKVYFLFIYILKSATIFIRLSILVYYNNNNTNNKLLM